MDDVDKNWEQEVVTLTSCVPRFSKTWNLILGVDNEFYFPVKAPFLVDLKKPELKIPHTVNFYIKVEPRVILGIW
eukprot:bmy_06179T0